MAEISDDRVVGRGECVPYARYGETVSGVVQQIEALGADVTAGLTRAALQDRLPPGAARNALDCALWDLEAKLNDTNVWQLAGLPEPMPVESAFTVSLGTPEAMASAARDEARRPLLKLKLTGSGDLERVEAVRRAAPGTRLVVDANEAWTADMFLEFGARYRALGVEMIEQPLPAGDDAVLAEVDRPIPVCADESCHTSADVRTVADRYDLVNLKLDKTGGFTEALRFLAAAREANVGLMIGCMMCTSLGIAPAVLLGGTARYNDLDAPLWLARDRDHPIEFDGSTVRPPRPELWG